MKKKDDFYSLDNALSTGADYIAVLGARTNGKSYEAKLQVLKDCWENDYKFVYLRRLDKDTKIETVESWYEDMVEDDLGNHRIAEVTNGVCTDMCVWRHGIWLCNIDEKGKKKRVKQIGYAMALTNSEQYKSMSFPHYQWLIWEEFITTDPYLPREMEKFMSIISTVFRQRKARVVLVANTVAVMCPCFTEWGIEAKQLKQGTITIYHHETLEKNEDGTPINIKIAVDYCDNKVKQGMIFGKHQKMIVNGEWETRAFPHLPEPMKMYRQWYKIYIVYNNFKFVMHLLSDSNKYSFLYVYPYTKETLPDNARVITDVFMMDRLVTNSLKIIRSKYDKIILQLLNERRIVFSDNMTGTTFYQTLDALKLQ